MANVRYQKPKLKADIPTLFHLYTQHAVLDAKTLRETFSVSPNTALRAIRLCIRDSQAKGEYFPSNPNEVSTKNFFAFYGWDISHIESAYRMLYPN